MTHRLTIECGDMTSAELQQLWGETVDAMVDMNAHLITDHPGWMDELLARPPTYEKPRRARNVDQVVATIDIVRKRGRATCVEWAAICAGDARAAGDLAAHARLVDQVDEHDKPIPGAYHVIVVYGNGQERDVTQMLPGYNGNPDAWWLDHGHCCRDCALGIDGAKTTCAPCAAAEAERAASMPRSAPAVTPAMLGCKTGTCRLDALYSNARRGLR